MHGGNVVCHDVYSLHVFYYSVTWLPSDYFNSVFFINMLLTFKRNLLYKAVVLKISCKKNIIFQSEYLLNIFELISLNGIQKTIS